ncbi:uncharacterized protein K460DRAFT_271464 [Cucurbitaria berberidis CBS 394.84]|uniref:Uncharacterized protein n=1 Tax=Cucurbitaria berberidis CBS 394.84 TaxID=1168544 RepID=A0A9P4LDD2_9PLEO|nr:uncharacterized protein K460DRAFT_271464 [Cucurbitaria berberidis CBS 394.84]KAF1851751.1 hypothetical protein K460DRAFT_271464 [Cucurbitaria berberidis CBS 394.84]
MHAIHFLLSIYTYTLCGHFHRAAAEAISSAQLSPDGFFALNNYEVLSAREEGDEDIVHIRKRAGQEDCGTDCLDYSGWTRSGLMDCAGEDQDAEDTAGEDVPEKRTLLEKRGRKPPTLCNYGMVYDTGDPTEPLKKEWFELQQRKKRWTKDLVGRKPTKGNKPRRCYAAEHVLEWQLLQEFIEADSMKGQESRCMLLFKYFGEKMPKATYKVKVARNNGKLGTNNHFEYEDRDHTLDRWKEDEPKERRYELVLMNQDANGRKANVWAEQNILPKPSVHENTNKMRENQENSKTLEWLFENKYYEDSIKSWPDNKGKCKAIYHYNGEVYKERGLKKEWLDWMKEKHKARMDALTKAMDDKLGVFSNNPGVITKLRRWDYSGIFRREVKEPNCGYETDQKIIDQRVALLKDAYKNMKRVESELKLD